jgi:hypothetical protein
MPKKYPDSETMLEQVPMELWAIAELYEHQSNLGEHADPKANPFYVFLYLTGFPNREYVLPYDFTPADHLAYLEIQLLAKALSTYALIPRSVEMWLEQLLELVDNEQLADSESL